MADADLTVALSGADEVKSALNDIALTGANAFQKLADAVQTGNFAGLAELIGGPVAGAIVAAAQAILEFTENQAKMVVQLDALATQAGTTIERVEGLKEVFAGAGVGAEQFTRSMQQLAIRLANQGAQIAQNARDAAAQQEASDQRVISSSLAVEEAKERVSEASSRAAQQSRSDANTAVKDVLSIQEAQNNLAETTTGQKNPALDNALKVQEALQRVQDARLKQEQDNLASAEHQAQADLQDKKGPLEIAEAQNAAVKANNAAYDELTRNIKVVSDALNGLGPLVGKLSDVSSRVIGQAIQLNAAGQNNVAPGNVTTTQFIDALSRVFQQRTLSRTQEAGVLQNEGLGGRAGGGAAAAKLTALFEQGPEKLNAAIEKFTQGAGALSAADVQAAHDLVEGTAKFDAEAEKFGEKAATSLIQVIQQAFGGKGLGKAGGGLINGPGSGTSDSIPAWLSHGEFVMKAQSVQKYGVSLFHALNNMEMPGFAMGGLVRPVRLAGGGPAPAGSVVNLTIGGEHFNGLRAPDATAQKIKTFAINQKTAETGVKPSWVS